MASSGPNITILGVAAAEALLQRLQGSVATVGKYEARVGTNLKYAWGIEFGRRRDGRLARKAGGAFYLTTAFQQVKPRIKTELRAALLGGPSGMLDALRRLAFDVEAGAKERVPVKTGNLRRSIHTVIG